MAAVSKPLEGGIHLVFILGVALGSYQGGIGGVSGVGCRGGYGRRAHRRIRARRGGHRRLVLRVPVTLITRNTAPVLGRQRRRQGGCLRRREVRRHGQGQGRSGVLGLGGLGVGVVRRRRRRRRIVLALATSARPQWTEGGALSGCGACDHGPLGRYGPLGRHGPLGTQGGDPGSSVRPIGSAASRSRWSHSLSFNKTITRESELQG